MVSLKNIAISRNNLFTIFSVKRTRILILFWIGLIASIMALLKLVLIITNFKGGCPPSLFEKSQLILVTVYVAFGFLPSIWGLRCVYTSDPTGLNRSGNVVLLSLLSLVWFLLVDCLYIVHGEFLRILAYMKAQQDQEKVFEAIAEAELLYTRMPSLLSRPWPSPTDIIFLIMALLQIVHAVTGVNMMEIREYADELKKQVSFDHDLSKMEELAQYCYKHIPSKTSAGKEKQTEENDVENGTLLQSNA